MCHPFVEVVSHRLKVLSDFTAACTAEKKLNVYSLRVCLHWVLVLLDRQKKMTWTYNSKLNCMIANALQHNTKTHFSLTDNTRQMFKVGIQNLWQKHSQQQAVPSVCHTVNGSGAHLMVRTRAHLNTEQMAEANLYLQRCGRLERQAHYAVWDVLFHRLTFIMLNLPRSPRRAKLHKCKFSPLPALPHCNNHFSRWGLMGMERSVTVLPCIRETCSWKVQDSQCLLSDGLTTCHSDSPLLKSGCCALCWGPLWEGVAMIMPHESSAMARKSN